VIAVVDYGVGNLFSLMAALRLCGADAVLTAQPEDIEAASHVILPGVGAFGDAAARLRESGAVAAVAEKGRFRRADAGHLPGHAAAVCPQL
jgi:glutamine amidotransferase